MSWDDDCWIAREGLVEEAQVNLLYHRKRERIFASLDRWSKALSLIFGSAAASTFLKDGDAKAVAGLLVACATLPALVFTWSDKARLHSELAAEYTHIEAEIEAAGVLAWSQIDAFKSRLVSIRAKEPPELASLLISCQNELYIAHDQEDMVINLGWRRFLMHAFSLPVTTTGQPAGPNGPADAPQA